MVSWKKAVGEGLTFLKYAFVYLLNGHFIGNGPKRLKYLLLNNCADVPECCGVFKDEERGWGGKVELPSFN